MMAEKHIHTKRISAAFLALVLLLSLITPVGAADTLGSFRVTARETYKVAPGVIETALTLNIVPFEIMVTGKPASIIIRTHSLTPSAYL